MKTLPSDFDFFVITRPYDFRSTRLTGADPSHVPSGGGAHTADANWRWSPDVDRWPRESTELSSQRPEAIGDASSCPYEVVPHEGVN